MVKPITRKANARGLDRSALARAKHKTGMRLINSSIDAGAGREERREKMSSTGINLVAEGSAIRRESDKIHNDAVRGVVKRPKSKDDNGRR